MRRSERGDWRNGAGGGPSRGSPPPAPPALRCAWMRKTAPARAAVYAAKRVACGMLPHVSSMPRASESASWDTPADAGGRGLVEKKR
eukprot:365915-Chlamydomonas_euryale.AAC.3